MALGLFCGLDHGARAQVTLEAKGHSTQALRAKKVEAEIQIGGAFSQTRVLTTFQNELSSRTEADFNYTVPNGAVVTGFAYWFKGEKVVARVVEKERARRIYDTIKYQRRDPALIEQTGKNTFHARIFPVEANADLKIEMRWIQALPSDEKGLLYTLPLKPSQEGKGVLDALQVRAEIQSDFSITRVINNYKLPFTEKNGAQIFTLSQKNYRPPQDLTIRLERPRRALHASLYSAPSGGRDGFFALALTSSQNLTHPRLAISGVATYGVRPAHLPAMKKHQTFVVVGRYRGSGKALVALSGYAAGVARREVCFESKRENNSLATKLWAARQIELLAPHNKVPAKNHDRVVELSMRFTLPSPVTSWLAVPKSEWKSFERRIAEDDMYEYGPQLAQLVRQGKGNSLPARRMRAIFNHACRVMGANPAQQLAQFLNAGREEKYYAWQRQRDDAARKMARAIALGQTRTARSDARRVALLNRRLGVGAREGLDEIFNAALQETARDWAREKAKPRPRIAVLHRLEHRMTRLESYATDAAGAARFAASRSVVQDEMGVMGTKIADEIAAGRGDGETVQELRQRVRKRGEYFGVEARELLEKATRQSIANHARTLATQVMNQEWSRQPDETQISLDREKLARLIPSVQDREKILRDAERAWGWRAYQFAGRIVQEHAKEKPDVAELDYAQKSLERATRVAMRQQGKNTDDENAVRAAVEQAIAQQEVQNFGWKIANLKSRIQAENGFENPDQTRISRLQKEIEDTLQNVSERGRNLLNVNRNYYDNHLETARQMLEDEYREAKPDITRISHFENEMVRLADKDWYYSSGYNGGRKISDPPLYQKTRAERIRVRVEKEKIAARLKSEDATLSTADKRVLSTQRAALAKRENELRVRMGDPLIQVDAPQDAQQVVAIFPDGAVKNLQWNADAQKWEVRFDVPAYAAEGQYTVQIMVVLADGSRQNLAFRFGVDVTAPRGAGSARRLVNAQNTAVLRLEFEGDADTARVEALLPWNETLALAPSTQTENAFFALAPVPGDYHAATARVEFLVTDHAHNRTSVTVDMSR
jgi:hypothetical protein